MSHHVSMYLSKCPDKVCILPKLENFSPNRHSKELANAMQSGQGVRDALSPVTPVRRLFRRGGSYYSKRNELHPALLVLSFIVFFWRLPIHAPQPNS